MPSFTHADGLPVIDPTPSATPPATSDKPLSQLPVEHYQRYLSDVSKKRKPNTIRNLFPLEHRPGMISLLAGKPNPDTFPIASLRATVRSPDGSSTEEVEIPQERLAAGLQYGSTAGYEPFVAWVEGLQTFAHQRNKGEGWRVSIGGGSTDLIYKAFHALINPGDSVLIESPVYSGVLPMIDELQGKVVAIDVDEKGIRSADLRTVLENWPESKPRPKFLYTVPYGCNPTGITASTERRREILELAHKYDFIILEDDPYYYLYYGEAERPPSYFKLELEQPQIGRVLRFDSVSKILSAGIRIGFATGPLPLLNAMDLHTQTANLQPNSLTQVLALAVVEKWGYEGFMRHTQGVSDFYRARRDVFEAAMHRQLGGLAEWSPPEAGMFFWFKLKLRDGSAVHTEDEDSEALVRGPALDNGVIALPGTTFLATGGRTAYVRASFSLQNAENVEEALRRLRKAILEARGEKDETKAPNGV